MAFAASMRPELGQILYAGSNFPHPIQFCSSKEGPDHSAQNWPGSDLDGLVRFWPNASGLEANRCARIISPGSGRTQPAHYHLPSFRLRSILPSRQPGSYCANLARIWFGSGWLCQVLVKWIQSRSKPVCKNNPAHFWLMLLSQSRMDVNQMRLVYWDATSHSTLPSINISN